MKKAPVLGVPAPRDVFSVTLSVGFSTADIENVLRPGLHVIAETIEGLAAKARGILAEVDSPDLSGSDQRLITIDLHVSLEDPLRKRLVAQGGNSGKILALVSALKIRNTPRSHELLKQIRRSLDGVGVPLKVKSDARLGRSVFIRLFGETVRLKLAHPD